MPFTPEQTKAVDAHLAKYHRVKNCPVCQLSNGWEVQTEFGVISGFVNGIVANGGFISVVLMCQDCGYQLFINTNKIANMKIPNISYS